MKLNVQLCLGLLILQSLTYTRSDELNNDPEIGTANSKESALPEQTEDEVKETENAATENSPIDKEGEKETSKESDDEKGAHHCRPSEINWPGRKCSIFPIVSVCLRRDFNRMYEGVSIDFLTNDQISTPLDYGLRMIDTFTEGQSTPVTSMLRFVMPATRASLRLFFSSFRVFKGIILRFVDFLEAVRLIPPSLAAAIKTALAEPVSPARSYNPLLSNNRWLWGPPGDLNCPASGIIDFWKITALRAYIKQGLRVWLWLGVPMADVVKIRETLVRFLKNDFGDEFKCPFNPKPCEGPLADFIKSVFGASVTRAFESATEALLRWVQCDSTSLDSILTILRNFTSTIKGDSVKWNKLLRALESLACKFRDSITSIIRLIFNGDFKWPKPPRTTTEMASTSTEPTSTSTSGPPPECNASPVGWLIDLPDKLNPANFANFLGAVGCNTLGATPNSLNIADAASTIKMLLQIKPIAGITKPQSVVNVIEQNIPQQLTKTIDLFTSLLDKVKNLYAGLTCTSIQDVGATVSNYTTVLGNLLSAKPLSCITKLQPKISELNTYTNVKLAACVKDAFIANAEIADDMRTNVDNLKNDVVSFYESLKNITPATILSHINNGLAVVSRLRQYVKNIVNVDLSKVSMDTCVQGVLRKASSKVERLKNKIIAC